jgi:hypothetical protein
MVSLLIKNRGADKVAQKMKAQAAVQNRLGVLITKAAEIR